MARRKGEEMALGEKKEFPAKMNTVAHKTLKISPLLAKVLGTYTHLFLNSVFYLCMG